MFLFFLIYITFSCISQNPNSSTIPKETRQIILVITPSETAYKGLLYRYKRDSDVSAWSRVAKPIPVVIGKNGLGWGIGLQQPVSWELPAKREGDGKSPAGVFTLSVVFGFAPKVEMEGLKLPYIQVTKMLECVDDVNSKYYNQIIRRNRVDSIDWHSSERMWQIIPKYDLGVVIDYNTTSPRAGEGSCIFLHIWGGPMEPTQGCTAMAPEEMQALAFWLEESKKPILVQLTESLYRKEKNFWDLPDIFQ